MHGSDAKDMFFVSWRKLVRFTLTQTKKRIEEAYEQISTLLQYFVRKETANSRKNRRPQLRIYFIYYLSHLSGYELQKNWL